MQTNKAFTLVELIVVITILAVLATIAFTNFQGYTASARDGVRISDIISIEKSLIIFQTKDGKYPLPDNKVDILSNGKVLNYQGDMGAKIQGTIGVNGGGVDPVTGDYYTYTINKNRVKYQLLSYLEQEENLKKTAFLHASYASDYSDRYPQLSGDKLGIIVNSITQEPLQVTGTGFDISQTTSDLEVHISNKEVIRGNNVSLGIILSNSSCKRIKEFNNDAKDGKYMIDPLGNGNEFEVLCDMTTDGGGWTLYSGKNIHELPDIGFLTVYPDKLNINFNQIRWNYKSPLGRELPLIYKLYNQAEGKLLLANGQEIDANLRDNGELHYENTQDFSNAITFGEVNTSGIDLIDFKEGIILDNIHYMASWKNTTSNTYYINMGTVFTRNKVNVGQYLLFPSTPYYGTYNIGTETFEGISAYGNWTDNRSIAIWIK